ncbi:MAG: hypothetical protein VXX85_02410 [Candidatus Margulisiibacteriota bacterium]|nr:hypothetical protein [Candidatus Margulisiibacteriota bacterium]
MNVNFNPSRGVGAGYRSESSRSAYVRPFNSPSSGINPNPTGFGTVDPFKPTYPGFNPKSPNESLSNNRQDSILKSNDSLAYSFQGAHVTKTSASDCREICEGAGVKEYRRDSSTDGNLGLQGSSKTGKGGLGVNGTHEENEVCICYPPNTSNQCSVSI